MSDSVYVCTLDQLIPNVGVAALLPDQQQAAVFLVVDPASKESTLYAIDNIDPFGKAAVMSRGIIGDHQGVVCVSSPLHHECFSLETGECLEDPSVQLVTYPVRVEDNKVYLTYERAQ